MEYIAFLANNERLDVTFMPPNLKCDLYEIALQIRRAKMPDPMVVTSTVEIPKAPRPSSPALCPPGKRLSPAGLLLRRNRTPRSLHT